MATRSIIAPAEHHGERLAGAALRAATGERPVPGTRRGLHA
ncbi:hypothetical protein [Burkholderia glumae]|nr:hypothetical protein [Burkholderia glumae]